MQAVRRALKYENSIRPMLLLADAEKNQTLMWFVILNLLDQRSMLGKLQRDSGETWTEEDGFYL